MLVSVRLMTYNHAEYIEEALKGILLQEADFPIQVVIGDDFSIDGTLEIIKAFLKKNYKENFTFKILERPENGDYWQRRQKNGRLENFTDLLTNCDGKYIALLDGDDYWTDPYKLQKQVDFMEANPSFYGVGTNSLKIFSNTNESIPFFESNENRVLEVEDFLKERKFHTASFLFKNDKKIYENFPKNILSGDRFLFLSVALQGKIMLLPELTNVYRKNVGISTKVTSQQMKKDLGIINYFKLKLTKNQYLTLRKYIILTIFSYSHTIYKKDFYWYLIEYFYFNLYDENADFKPRKKRKHSWRKSKKMYYKFKQKIIK